MKLIIAGGRDITLTNHEYNFLHELHRKTPVTEVVSGNAPGVDRCGEEWARFHEIPIKLFIPNWKMYPKVAGKIRNRKMAEYADALVAFHGGSGTRHMIETAVRFNLKIYNLSGKQIDGVPLTKY